MEKPEARLFHLERDVDETGVSGTGTVAYGVRFNDGTCVMRWCVSVNSTAYYQDIDDLLALHGHQGATRLVWEDEPTDSAPALGDVEFRALLNALMTADPHPWSKHDDEVIRSLLNVEAARRGFEDWVHAFHRYSVPTESRDVEPTPEF